MVSGTEAYAFGSSASTTDKRIGLAVRCVRILPAKSSPNGLRPRSEGADPALLSVSGAARISLSLPSGKAADRIEVFGTRGERLAVPTSDQAIDFSGFPNGLYHVIAVEGNRSYRASWLHR